MRSVTLALSLQVIASDEDCDSGSEGALSPVRAPAPAGGGPRSPAERAPPARVFDMEADISKLEPATFSTIPRGQPEPMLRLSWNHKVGERGRLMLLVMAVRCREHIACVR